MPSSVVAPNVMSDTALPSVFATGMAQWQLAHNRVSSIPSGVVAPSVISDIALPSALPNGMAQWQLAQSHYPVLSSTQNRGHYHRSKVDHFLLPATAAGHIRQLTAPKRSMRALQVIPSADPRDQSPRLLTLQSQRPPAQSRERGWTTTS